MATLKEVLDKLPQNANVRVICWLCGGEIYDGKANDRKAMHKAFYKYKLYAMDKLEAYTDLCSYYKSSGFLDKWAGVQPAIKKLQRYIETFKDAECREVKEDRAIPLSDTNDSFLILVTGLEYKTVGKHWTEECVLRFDLPDKGINDFTTPWVETLIKASRGNKTC